MGKKVLMIFFLIAGVVAFVYGTAGLLRKFWNDFTKEREEARKSMSSTKRPEPPVINGERTSEFPGGEKEFMAYIQENFDTPDDCDEAGSTARVTIRFAIDTNGVVTDIKKMEETGGCAGIGEEAIRVLQACPKWYPEYRKGKKVKAYRIVPIRLNQN
jgi:hypothetical protein